MKLLELPTVELEERIHSEILDNPALEEGRETPENGEESTDFEGNEDNNDNSEPNDDISLGDYRTEDDIPDYKLQEHNRSREGVAEEIPFSDAVSFYEILKEQLAMQDLTDEQREIAEYLIGSLDDDGLLRKSIESVMDELAIYSWNLYHRERTEQNTRNHSGFRPRPASVHATFKSVCSFRSNVKQIPH